MIKKPPKIKSKLRSGDQKVIAEMTGLSYDYVRQVMRGVRNNQKIILAAEQLVTAREKLFKNSG